MKSPYYLRVVFKSNEHPFQMDYDAYKITNDEDAIEWARFMQEGLGNMYTVALYNGSALMPHAEADARSFVVSVTKGMRGWYAVMLSRDPDGFWEPEQTGVGSYDTKTGAMREAQQWARAEGLEFRLGALDLTDVSIATKEEPK